MSHLHKAILVLSAFLVLYLLVITNNNTTSEIKKSTRKSDDHKNTSDGNGLHQKKRYRTNHRDKSDEDSRFESPYVDVVNKAIRNIYVSLCEEEKAILERFPKEDLDRAVIEADNELIRAIQTKQPDLIAEADKKYLLTLNLAAKLADPPDAPSPEIIQRQKEYFDLVKKERERIKDLPASEQTEHLSRFKDEYFADDFDKQPEDLSHQSNESLMIGE